MSDKEVWKSIPGFPGYEVSNHGRVKGRKATFLRPVRNHKGYLYVSLYISRHRHNKFIHRLVAENFVNGYSEGLFVNHLDEDKTNNRFDNLEWVTNHENNVYGTRCAKVKAKLTNGKCSKPVAQFTRKGELVNVFPSTIEAERQLGLHQANICRCALGKAPTAYGYIWRYVDHFDVSTVTCEDSSVLNAPNK